MDYYQGVVADYLSADRAMFVRPESCIQLHPGASLKKGAHWYCDILAVSFREQSVYLCEVTFSKSLSALLTRLREWDSNWAGVRAALARDNHIPETWPVRPWAFVPGAQRDLLSRKVSELLDPDTGPHEMPRPLVTDLEEVVPWLYSTPHELPGAKDREA